MELPEYWFIEVTKEVKEVLQKTELSFHIGYDYTIGGFYSSTGKGERYRDGFRRCWPEYHWVEITFDYLNAFINQDTQYEIY